MLRIRPTRMTVTDQRPSLSYRVAIDAPGVGRWFWVDLALATSPSLFDPSAIADRQPDNFVTFSNRFAISGGDAIIEIPPRILMQFAKADRLYVGAALYNTAEGGAPLSLLRPDENAVYVAFGHFTGAGLYRQFGFANRPDSLPTMAPAPVWSGDQPLPEMPNTLPDSFTSPPSSIQGSGHSRKGLPPMNHQSNGFMHRSSHQAPMPQAIPAPPPAQNAQPVDYDDGFGTPPPVAAPPIQQVHTQPGQASPQLSPPVAPGQTAPQPMPVMPGQAAPQPMPVMPGQPVPQPMPVMPGQTAPQPMPVMPNQAAPQPMPSQPAVTAPVAQQAYSRPLDYVLPEFDSANPIEVIRTLRDAWSRYSSFTAGVSNTTVFPFSAIVCFRTRRKRKSDNADAGFSGTGFYIGPNLLLTNAHNFAENGSYHAAHSAKVYAGLNSQNGPGVTPSDGDAISVETINPANSVTIHPLYTSSDSDVSYGHDIAVVRVQNSAPNGQFFGIANYSPGQDQKIAVCGYGASSAAQRDSDWDWQDLLPEAVGDYRQRMDADIIREIAHKGECILYNLQTLSGNSGSPVFLEAGMSDGGTVDVVGVHSSRVGGNNFRNRGVWLTPDKRDWALSGGTTPVSQSQGYYAPQGHYPAQGYANPPHSQAMVNPGAIAAAEIVAAAGIAAFQNTSGDLSWNLSNMEGWQPANGHPTPTITVPRETLRTMDVELNSPVYQGTLQGNMYAHFNMRFHYDGTGVGGITVEPAPYASHDNLTGGMRIDMQINPLLETAQSRAQTGTDVAIIEVVMMYTYEWTVEDNDQVTVIYRLYGDGTYDSHVRGGAGKLDDTDTTYTSYRR